jgi:hypothetical protein
MREIQCSLRRAVPKAADGTWRSTRACVEEYLTGRYERDSAPSALASGGDPCPELCPELRNAEVT